LRRRILTPACPCKQNVPAVAQWDDMQQILADLERADLRRDQRVVDSPCGPHVTLAGRRVTCLCSNDYLALAGEASIRAAAVRAVERWGVGAGASRLVSGTTGPHVQLEARLAAFKRCEAAVVTTSGWVANHVAVGALAGAGDLVLCDKLNHASILDAARSCGARLRTFAHRDTDRLVRLLERRRAAHRRCLIVTDSLFSMDGDFAPLKELVQIKDAYDARLLIDEAHATGVIGPAGRGVAELLGVEERIDATVGTLSKALGCVGGFVAGRGVLADVIRNTARAYIYTTAPPPAICAAAIRALDVIRDEPERRRGVLALAEQLRAALGEAGLPTGQSTSQIVPVILGAANTALDVSRKLLDDGFLVPAIRPPTVPPGTSRLRVSLSAGHNSEDVQRFVEALARAMGRVASQERSNGHATEGHRESR